jgi:arylsulfatase A-like enzyme
VANRIRVIVAVAAAVACAAGRVSAAAERRPNIVLIVADDMGYADAGIQGGRDVRTPNIDSIALSGVRCTSGYVTCPVCSPSRAALMTGRYQQRFGHEFNPASKVRVTSRFGLAEAETTIAQRLKEAGYATGMVGKWHLGHAPKYYPVRRGFDEFYGFLEGSHSYDPGDLQGQEATRPLSAIMRGTKPVEPTEYLTDAFRREAVAYVGRHKAEPFFLYLAFNAVHTPLQAPMWYRDRFRNIADPRRRTYAAMVSAMDDAVGAVMEKLRKEGLEENTLVFFLSDNGGAVVNASDNWPLRGHKATTWEGGIRVPFFVQWKGHLPAGAVYDRPVAQIDILPTALAAAGGSVDPGWKLDGVNLLPFLQTRSTGVPHEALYWRFGEQRAVRMGDWKLVMAPDRGRGAGVRGALHADWRLYNLARDVAERNDLSAQQPEKVKQLEQAWEQWNSELAPPAWAPPQYSRRHPQPS